MLVSNQTDIFARRFGEFEAIKLLARIGWDALDFSMFDKTGQNSILVRDDWREYAKSLRKTADECGVFFNQAHAPFASYVAGKDEYNTKIHAQIVRSIEIAGILGVDIIIVHPISLKASYEEQKELNLEFYNSLLPYCKQYGVKVALENMWGWSGETHSVTPAACSTAAEFVDYIDSLDRDWFCACLDIGHGEMQGSGALSSVELIKALGGDRLKALHVHDNDKIGDLHTLPFTRSINWNDITAALIEVNYSGIFTFEADNFIAGFPNDLSEAASKLMLEVGRYLVRDMK
jgi:Sugar phosphate isomerases/epimerases